MHTFYTCDKCGSQIWESDDVHFSSKCGYCGEVFFDDDSGEKKVEFDEEMEKLNRWDFRTGRSYPVLSDVPVVKNRFTDIPVPDAFVEQGLCHEAEHKFPSDKVIFNEFCVRSGIDMLVVQPKTYENTAKQWHLREETLIEWLNCSYDFATELSEIFQRLSLNRKAVVSIVHGYVKNGSKTAGLRSVSAKELQQYIDYFRDLADELDLCSTSLESYRKSFLEQSQELFDEGFFGKNEELTRNDMLTVMMFIEQQAEAAYEAALKEFESRLDEDSDEAEEFVPPENPFIVRRLHHENESCSEKFIEHVQFADWDQLKNIMKNMFSDFGRNLTPSQRSQAWDYIKERRSQLRAYHFSNRYVA